MSIERLLEFQQASNIADFLSEDKVLQIGKQVCEDFRLDCDSRKDWKDTLEKSEKNLKQCDEKKSFPWEGASNVKYPLTAFACISFASQVYRELIKNGKIVEVKVVGADPQAIKENRAKRITEHMNYQLLGPGKTWEPETDQLLHALAFYGTMFRKGFYDGVANSVVFEACKPYSVVINNNVKSLESARRISHEICLYKNDIITKIRAGVFSEIELDSLEAVTSDRTTDPIYDLIEQHLYLDLDDDGYAEPYIVVVHKTSEKVLGIYARYDLLNAGGITVNDKKEIIHIKPVHYFIDYHLIKDAMGGFYSIGFGHLLYHVNEVINTLHNQLIDSGTLANIQGGFVGRGFKVKNGSLKYKMGEFQVLDVGTAQSVADNIAALPFKEPSAVLFQMLGMVIQTGKELALVNDLLTGDIQTQNSPATTVLTMLERGTKVFSAIIKRIFISLKKEFELLYYLNKTYLDETQYIQILDNVEAISKLDYENETFDVMPVANPSESSDVVRQAKIQALLMLLQSPVTVPLVNAHEIVRRALEAWEIRNLEMILPPPNPNPPPSPDMIKAQAEIQKMMHEAESDKLDKQLKLMELKLKEKEINISANESGAKIAKMEADSLAALHNAKTNKDKIKVTQYKVDKDTEVKKAQVNKKEEK